MNQSQFTTVGRDAPIAPGGAPSSATAAHKRVAIYVRKSTTMGLEQDFNSLDSQTAAIRAYIAAQSAQGWVETAIYSDGGISGATTDRPELKRLMADIKARKIDAVCVYKYDRLSRSTRDFYNLLDFFEKNSVAFVSVSQQLDTSTPVGRMVMGILASFAEFEREMTRERIRDKFQNSLRNGGWIGGSVPFGYRLVDKKLVKEDSEAELVPQMFQWFLDTGSTKAVAKKLNDAGAKRNGRDWRPLSVARALKNIRYIGKCRAENGVFDGQQPALVDPDLFGRVQRRIAELAPAGGGPGRTRNASNALLQGRIYCGDCNGALTLKWSSRRADSTIRYGYYVCSKSAKLATNTCRVKSVPAALVEGEVEKIIETVLGKSLELATAVSRRTGIAAPRILGGLRAPGVLWQELNLGERYDLIRSLVARATVYESSLDLILDTAELGPLVNALSSVGEVQPDRSLLVRIPLVIRTISGIRRIGRAVSMKPPLGGSRLSRPLVGRDDPIAPLVHTPATLAQNPLLRALARGHAYLRMIDRGEVKTIQEISRKFGVEHHLIMRSVKVALLSPTIQRAILNGSEPPGLSHGRILALDTLDWSAQESALGF